MANLDTIREALIVLMTADEKFVASIELSTSSRQAIRTRFDKWRSTVDAIVDRARKEPRCFSRQLKQALFDKRATCEFCGQKIADVDDAAVDHVEMYWLGGKTIEENARLSHRYCNWHRPKKSKGRQ